MHRSEVTLFLCCISFFGYSAEQTCDAENLTVASPCPATWVCDKTTKTCQCLPGLKKVNETFCTGVSDPQSTTSSLVASEGPSVAVTVIVPLVVLIAVIVAVYAGKKYRVVPWVRDKMARRHSTYDEFMIGRDDDDPPLQ